MGRHQPGAACSGHPGRRHARSRRGNSSRRRELELRDSLSMPSIPAVPAPAVQPPRAAAPPPVPAPAADASGLELERDGEGAFAPPSPDASAARGPIEGVERSEEIDLRAQTSRAIEASGMTEPLVTHGSRGRRSARCRAPEHAVVRLVECLRLRDDGVRSASARRRCPHVGLSSPSGFGVPFTGETASTEETPAAFVTETMAELYLQQGFTQEALAVYRQLLAQNPNDRSLRDRVASIEGGSRSSVAVAAVSDEVIEQAHRRHAREPETIRSFFAALMRRRVLQRYEDSDEGRAAGQRADAAEEAAYGEALGASNSAPANRATIRPPRSSGRATGPSGRRRHVRRNHRRRRAPAR